jgi:hypothetical protein
MEVAQTVAVFATVVSVLPCLSYLWLILGAPLFPRWTYAALDGVYGRMCSLQSEFEIRTTLATLLVGER